eukprot:358234-Chlamydomonas_euryale.AAC.3
MRNARVAMLRPRQVCWPRRRGAVLSTTGQLAHRRVLAQHPRLRCWRHGLSTTRRRHHACHVSAAAAHGARTAIADRVAVAGTAEVAEAAVAAEVAADALELQLVRRQLRHKRRRLGRWLELH